MTAEHERRRTFAIISHPDAGKTTLTEKLLLSGGAIHLAGQVREKGNNRRTRSDWMKIEQERGISVTSSVMTFERDGLVFNLLDTPGHEDFSEDTYRTLTAVDSAIMVIDAARGIESQTRKLFEVCRMRDIPILTMVNKLDREARDPFEILDEIQEVLTLDIAPILWPIGMGRDFYGCYDLQNQKYLTSSEGRGGTFDKEMACPHLDDPAIKEMVPENILQEAGDGIELARAGYSDFDHEAYLAGYLSPVFFGSALKSFAVSSIVDFIARYAPSPRPSPADTRIVKPSEKSVSGFVFKVQANMDKNHRDRVAFMRVCSGDFRRGMKLRQVRTGKDVMMHSPIFFFAQDREIAENAGPGDVIGIPNHGTVRVGDTFTEGEEVRFTGLPVFAPEILRRVRLGDTSRIKQLRQALDDLAEEGLVQVFVPAMGSQRIVGVVGLLQLDVLTSRAKQEYRIDIDFETIPYDTARWLTTEDPKVLDKFLMANKANIVRDREDRPVFLAKSLWELDYTMNKNEDITFLKTRELK